MQAPPSREPLRAEQVTKRYGDTIALDHVSVAVERGRCLVLIGESGSGKSLTAMAAREHWGLTGPPDSPYIS